MKHIWSLGWRAFGACCLMLFSFFFPSSAYAQRGNLQITLPELRMIQTLQLVRDSYVEPVGMDTLVDGAIRSLLEQLDPHSAYIPPKDQKKVQAQLEGKFYGIGIQFQQYRDTVRVLRVLPDGPSDRVGMLAGDKIVGVDGEPVAGVRMNTDEIVGKLRGEKGTWVRVGVYRGKDSLEFRMRRDSIRLNTVDAVYMATPEIGYVRFSSFSQQTGAEVREAIDRLAKQGMKGLILDMQSNSGGIMETSAEVSSLFLRKGQQIVYMEGRAMPRRDFVAPKDGPYATIPLVVLVDQYSASSAEIVAGALQDWDRALIVGRRTFGKGLVQTQVPVAGNAYVRLTTARYYTPTGRCIQAPYQLGDGEAYSKAFIARFLHAEQQSADSIHLPDSLLYRTMRSGRIVYGGGGIMPDVFIPQDSSRFTPRIYGYLRQGHFQQWAARYAQNNKARLQKDYPTYELFAQKWQFNDAVEKDFLELVDAQRGIVDSVPLSESERDILGYRLKAQLAGQLFDFSELIQSLNSRSPDYQQAVEILQNWKQRGAPLLKKGKKK